MFVRKNDRQEMSIESKTFLEPFLLKETSFYFKKFEEASFLS